MMPQTEDASANGTTIWQKLDEWANELEPWQKYVLAIAVRHGQLSDDQIDDAYELFLRDNDLGPEPDPPIEVPESITGRPAEAAPDPIYLTGLSDLEDVNALTESASLTFGTALTVIYGGNGTGKSGFARVLSNACFSRKPHEIHPDIGVAQEDDELGPCATITTIDGSQEVQEYDFDIGKENPDLRRITVFDTDVARTHLVDKNPFSFSPSGFDVFPEMTRVYGELAEELSAEIKEKNAKNIFENSFRKDSSAVSKAVSELSAKTDMGALKLLAIYGKEEKARLVEVDEQIQALRSTSVEEKLKNLAAAKSDIEAFKEKLANLVAHLSAEKKTEYQSQLSDLATKSKTAAGSDTDQFKQSFFTQTGTPIWAEFVKAAQALGEAEDPEYPRDEDHCLLCHRKFDEASATLVRRLLGIFGSDARQEAEAANAVLDASSKALKELDFDIFTDDHKVRGHIVTHGPALAEKIDAFITSLEDSRTAVVTILESAAGEIDLAEPDDLTEEIDKLIAAIGKDHARLKTEDQGAALKALEAEHVLLVHREVLSQHIDDIETYVEDLVWVKKANGGPKRALNSKHVTDKESELFEGVIGERYKEGFANECAALECQLPITTQTSGRRGQTVRSLTMPHGHKPDEILSEGEQRAVAIADFLTEVNLNPASAGIVLDDPVNSQDEDRKKQIAVRLVMEAKVRQVIIFSHERSFIQRLTEAAEREDVPTRIHWVQRDPDGKPGQVSLDDCPANTPQYRTAELAKKSLAKAKRQSGSEQLETIRTGMGQLRRTVEELVPKYLLKDVVGRWSDRVMVTALRRINWEADLVDEIVSVFEEISEFVEGHSHTEERGEALPEPATLEALITHVEGLRRRAKQQPN